MRRSLALLIALVIGAAIEAQGAQEILPHPARPQLAAGADTNDARFYALLARSSRKPDERYAAFYWANRIRPTRLDYLAGMVDALLARQPPEWRWKYVFGYREVRESPVALLVDSIRREINYRDPFYGMTPMRGSCSAAKPGKLNAEALVYRGHSALDAGCYPNVLVYIDSAIARDSMVENHLLIRALALYKLQRLPEAAADMQRAIAGVRRLQAQSIEQSLYNTAMLEYVTGMMHMSIGDAVSARKAFQRSLAEDLSFHMAHVRLAELARNRADLASALEALSLATQLRPDDSFAQAAYAQALLAAERYDEAREAYRRAVELSPQYADLRFGLAELHDRAGDASAAVRVYRDYLSRAPQADSLQMKFAEERIEFLEQQLVSTP